MKGDKNFQREKTGNHKYLNKNCWLVKNLDYSPNKRCQYCELKFHNCLFFRYLIISLISVSFIFILFFLVEGKISNLVVVSVFALVIIYGYFFNESTEKIIKANFAQLKANVALEELTKTLEERVKKRTKELERANIDLRRMDKVKSEFISTTSHQLRTPLTVVKGYISTILEKDYGELPKKMQKPLENIYISNERLIKLVNDILGISRIEAGKMEIKFEKASLEEIIVDIVKELENKAKDKNIYLKFEKPKKRVLKILIDENKIRQVILNIVDNAIKYTDQGGIIIKIKRQEDKYQIEIKDTGRGLTEEETMRLFQSFFRGKAGRRSWIEGAGLGLCIAKKFVKMHNGEIWVESPGEDKGSTFYINLPIKESS